MILLLLPLLATEAAAIPRQDPCIAFGSRVVVHGPGPSEGEVPLNASIWLSVYDGHAGDLSVSLVDPSDGRAVPVRVEVLYEVPNGAFQEAYETAIRVRVEELLQPRRSYALSWTLPSEGLTGGHVFTTGDDRDDTAPVGPPALRSAAGGWLREHCYPTYGLTVSLAPSTVTPALLTVVTLPQGLRGIGRTDPITAIHGQAGQTVTATVALMDLAGNVSTAASITEQTPSAFVGGSVSVEEGGCTTVRGGSTLAALIFVLGAALSARRRR